MTTQQLSSIFYEENVNSIPYYELVKLTHHGTIQYGSAVRRRRRNTSENRKEVSFKDIESEAGSKKKEIRKSPSSRKIEEQPLADSYKQAQKRFGLLDLKYIKEHNVSFSAFGNILNLTLRRTETLFRDGPQSLRMWTVTNDSSLNHNLNINEKMSNEVSQI